MQLANLDWVILSIFFLIVISIGWVASRTARKDTSQFFLGGRGMPWWLLGVSMVACTFSADTPNLVTDFVRTSGVAKNWAWWAFLITGMVTVFIYAKLWRRSDVLTDLEFYELRYSGKMASFLRIFRSVYLGLFFNVLIMASVSLAAIKIGAVMFGLAPWVTIVIGSISVAIYAGIGGLKGVIWADFFQYSIAMFGAIYAAVIALQQPEVGGLDGLLSHPDIQDKLSFIPDFSDPGTLLTLLIIPIAVQWWSVWYPGAEPGGGGYIAQRMLSAKNEKNAIGATLFFNFMHYAIRPWPWIIVALASLIIYPDLVSIHHEFPNIDPEYLKHDIAYPAMMSKLGPGWLGLVVASLIAAYMSTIGTHLNWGSSYIVNDFYKRVIKPDAPEKELVRVGQLSTLLLMLFSGIIALTIMENAQEAFNILLLSGAGSGAIYLLRWFWWRINALTEIVAMVSATLTAIILIFAIDDQTLTTQYLDAFTVRLLIAVGVTTIVWVSTTLLSKPEDEETLANFYRKTRPGGPGWKKIARKVFPDETKPHAWAMPIQILNVFIGSITVYAALFGIGSLIYGEWIQASVLLFMTVAGSFTILKLFHKLRADIK
ncbi:Na(+)/glucose symporter [Salinivirga cyanobacteriivorans]|uniref:Na(+)/glucose symporter n=1 Tax=Salinivirga cyanobacteriivorans TaxID=1307839 RepID=A0A0S2HY10_9BACT|nr:sodium:solute symporter family protein [Salinivirga cyanobacteriivorans]ALO14941.1 Na(+)/glucose symporter [Salinivirga cyanobacteriivorans]